MSQIVTPLETGSGTSATREKVLQLRDSARSMRDFKFQERQVERAERGYRGLLDSDVERADGKTWVQNPVLWEIIARFLPILMAQKPKFAMEGVGEDDSLLVKQATFGTDYIWRQQRMSKTSSLWAKRAMKTGTSFLYTYAAEDARGYRCGTKLLDYRKVTPDPAATDDSDWTYCFVELRMTLEEIEAHYGEAGVRLIFDKDLKPTAPPRQTVGGIMPGNPRGPSYARAGSALSIASGAAPMSEQLIRSPQLPQGQDWRYSVSELFLYDRSEIEVVDEFDGEEVRMRVQSYEKPRWIVMIEDQYDEELDKEAHCAHAQIPIIRLTADDDDLEFWGGGLLAPLLDAVEQVSDIQNIYTNVGRVSGQPWWKISTDSGIDVETIEGDAGMVLQPNPGAVCEMVPPPQMPPMLFELWNRLLAQINNASGVNEAARGNIGGLGEDTSGKAIQLSQEPFYTRMRLFQDNLESALSKWGHQSTSNAIQYMGDAWWVRILPPELAGQGLAWKSPREWDENDLREMYDIVMTTGSSLPANKDQRFAQALSLFNAGAFDPMKPEPARYELLKAADWPDYEQVVAKVTAAAPPMMPPGMGGALPGLPPGPDKGLGGGVSPEAQIALQANPEGEEPAL